MLTVILTPTLTLGLVGRGIDGTLKTGSGTRVSRSPRTVLEIADRWRDKRQDWR